jgi:cation transport regulator ChaC
MSKKQRYPSDDGRREATAAMRLDQEVGEVAPGITVVRSSTPRPMTLGPMLAALSSGKLSAQEDHTSTNERAGRHDSTANSEHIASVVGSFDETQHDKTVLDSINFDGTPLPDFPSKAPSAPPVPEELSDEEEDALAENSAPVSQVDKASLQVEESQEFDWLFEYGLEMDSTILNSPERLDGAALLYGPAVLKGYRILFGSVEKPGGKEGRRKTIATIVSGSDAASEVWGVLYRIPRRVRTAQGEEPALLDTLHDATSPGRLFRPVQAVVRETYRNRDIECVTYVATDSVQQHIKPYAPEQGSTDMLYVQRVNTLAKKLGLPETYLAQYMRAAQPAQPESVAVPRAERHTERVPITTMVRVEQDTEPLPAFREVGGVSEMGEVGKTPLLVRLEDTARSEEPELSASPWLIVFSVYLVVELLVVLTFAVMQAMGFGNTIITSGFTLLGVPWMVLVYGLLGGCISSLVSLGRLRMTHPPAFVVITWFTRPYVGAALALLSYLFLTSGFFLFDRSAGRHDAFFLLIGALAGLCESRIFLQQSKH